MGLLQERVTGARSAHHMRVTVTSSCRFVRAGSCASAVLRSRWHVVLPRLSRLAVWVSTFSRGHLWGLEPVNAQEVVDALAGIPRSRQVPVQANGIDSSTLVNGIEIAKAASGDDRELRRAWKGRTQGGRRAR